MHRLNPNQIEQFPTNSEKAKKRKRDEAEEKEMQKMSKKTSVLDEKKQ